MQEVDVEIGAVDAGVTASAIAARLKTQTSVRNVGGKWIHVALQTQQALLAADQKHTIDASVRRVARRTAFYLHGRMLEDKWPALLGVTLRASFPSALPKRGAIGSDMRVVAICTFHQAFRHAMMRRQRELRLDVTVASETELRLGFLEQTIVEPSRLFGQFRYREEVGLRSSQIHPLGIPRRFHQVGRMTIHTGNSMLHVGRMIEG